MDKGGFTARAGSALLCEARQQGDNGARCDGPTGSQTQEERQWEGRAGVQIPNMDRPRMTQG